MLDPRADCRDVVVSFAMEVLDVLLNEAAVVALTEHNYSIETLLVDGPEEPI